MARHLKHEFERIKTTGDRFAETIARFVGNMKFVYLHMLLFAVWIFVNAVAWIEHWDPYPFNLLTLAVSLEAIFLSTFVLIAQNRQERQSDLRSELDFEVNVKAEREIERILTELAALRAEVKGLRSRRKS